MATFLIEIKIDVRKCQDRSVFINYFPEFPDPFQSADFGLFFQVAKFLSIYPFHYFCSCSDFSLKNMYKFYASTCSYTHLLFHHFLSDPFPCVTESTSCLPCMSLSVGSGCSTLYCFGCRFKFCDCILSFLEFFCGFHWLLFKSLPVIPPTLFISFSVISYTTYLPSFAEIKYCF